MRNKTFYEEKMVSGRGYKTFIRIRCFSNSSSPVVVGKQSQGAQPELVCEYSSCQECTQN